jgi:hypothetical protein
MGRCNTEIPEVFKIITGVDLSVPAADPRRLHGH